MKRKLVLLGPILIVLVSSTATAAPCKTDTLNKYLVKGFTCTVEDKLFSKFNYLSSINNNGIIVAGPPANMIQVAPIKALPGNPPSFNPGLAFSSGAWTVVANQSIESVIDYAVTVLPGGPKIKDARLDLLVGLRTNDGSAKVDELVNGLLRVALITLSSVQNTQIRDLKVFAPAGVVDVQNTIRLDGGLKGSVVVSSVENRFSEAPVVKPGGMNGAADRIGMVPLPGRDAGARVGILVKYLSGPVNLRTSKVVINSLLKELGPGGAGELLPDLPIMLAGARPGSQANAAIFETPPRAIPKVRVEIQTKGQGVFHFLLRLERGTIPAFPKLCGGDPRLTTSLATSFIITGGVGDLPVEVETVQPWRCLDLIGRDPTKPRSLRVP